MDANTLLLHNWLPNSIWSQQPFSLALAGFSRYFPIPLKQINISGDSIVIPGMRRAGCFFRVAIAGDSAGNIIPKRVHPSLVCVFAFSCFFFSLFLYMLYYCIIQPIYIGLISLELSIYGHIVRKVGYSSYEKKHKLGRRLSCIDLRKNISK